MNVYLIGYRGVGKSTVARRLAQDLNRDFIDADEELERRAGKTIAEIFADGGEPAFRELEASVLADLVQRDGLIAALGGGVVLREDNRRAIAAGKVVWLTADAETIHRRVTADAATSARRPNLTAGGGIAEIRELLANREPLYRACADLKIDTVNATLEGIVGQIAEWLNPKSEIRNPKQIQNPKSE
jgi:shikimate kinase